MRSVWGCFLCGDNADVGDDDRMRETLYDDVCVYCWFESIIEGVNQLDDLPPLVRGIYLRIREEMGHGGGQK